MKINKSYFNHNYNIISSIKYPSLSIKAFELMGKNKFTFIINPSLNKCLIKELIENLFAVKILKINTYHIPPHKKRIGKYIGWKPKYKKAVVTLAKGNSISLFT